MKFYRIPYSLGLDKTHSRLLIVLYSNTDTLYCILHLVDFIYLLQLILPELLKGYFIIMWPKAMQHILALSQLSSSPRNRPFPCPACPVQWWVHRVHIKCRTLYIAFFHQQYQINFCIMFVQLFDLTSYDIFSKTGFVYD